MYLSLRKRLLAAANAVSNCVGDDVGARVRMRLALAIALAVTIGATIIEIPIGRAAVYYIDVKNPACSDTSGSGTTTKPYCSLSYVSTIAVPGDTFLFKAACTAKGRHF